MPTLHVGRTVIEYDLKRSALAKERRITVTPNTVEVLALASDDEDAIAGFLDRKRRWLYDTLRDMQRLTSGRHAVPRFMTGSKVPYRGRKVGLTVRRSDAERMFISYRNGFVIDLPAWAGEDTDKLVATELKLWLKQRARHDVRQIAASYGALFGLRPQSIHVAEMASGWGSCGQENNVLINWHLIFAPRRVLEYVVAHELVHLRHRSHGAQFWSALGIVMKDYALAKQWLDVHQAKLTSDFLRTT